MLKQLAVFAALTGGMLASTSAMALINGELLVGKRWTDAKGDGAQSLDKTLGLMLDPIPFVPVAFGAYYTMSGWNKDDFGAKKVDGSEYGLSVKAWLPLPGTDFVPYARLNYMLGGQVEMDRENMAGNTETFKNDIRSGGYALNIGLRYDVPGPIDVLLEGGVGEQKWKFSGSPEFTVKTKTLLIGIEAGI